MLVWWVSLKNMQAHIVAITKPYFGFIRSKSYTMGRIAMSPNRTFVPTLYDYFS